MPGLRIVKESKQAQPAILADMIEDIESPMCLAVLISKIPDYETKKQNFIASELQKLGLINKEEDNTEK